MVIKHPLSNYILNGREQTWIKLKPEYVDELAEVNFEVSDLVSSELIGCLQTIEAAVLGKRNLRYSEQKTSLIIPGAQVDIGAVVIVADTMLAFCSACAEVERIGRLRCFLFLAGSPCESMLLWARIIRIS